MASLRRESKDVFGSSDSDFDFDDILIIKIQSNDNYTN